MKDETVEVNLDDVKAFLESSEEVVLDLSAEELQPVMASSSMEETPANAPEPVDTPLRPELEPDADTHANRAVWNMNLPDAMSVKVTDMDKNLFLKAALNDAPLKLDIKLPALPDLPITCRTLSDKEISIIFAVLDAGMEDKTITNDAAFRSQLQALSTYLQVLSFGNRPYKYHTSVPDNLGISEAAAVLREHHTKIQGSVNTPQFSLAITALRVFTVKVKLCTDNLLNENFWKPLEADSE